MGNRTLTLGERRIRLDASLADSIKVAAPALLALVLCGALG